MDQLCIDTLDAAGGIMVIMGGYDTCPHANGFCVIWAGYSVIEIVFQVCILRFKVVN